MANFTGKQKKAFGGRQRAAVLVLVLGIAVFTLGGGNAETPPAAPQGSQPDVAVSGIPQPEVTPQRFPCPQRITLGRKPSLPTRFSTWRRKIMWK